MLDIKKTLAKIIGRIKNVEGGFEFQITGDVSIPTATHKTLGSFKPPKGVYLVLVTAHFSSNSNGARYIYGNMDNGTNPSTYMQMDERPANSYPCRFMQSIYFDGNTTYYVKSRQNSGATLTATVRAMFVKIGEEAVHLGG